MKVNTKTGILFGITILLFGCSTNNPNQTINTSKTGEVKINLYNPSKLVSKFGKFRIKQIDPTNVFYGNLSVTGLGISTPITNAVSNPVRLPNGSESAISLTASNIPEGNNRIIKVDGLDKDSQSLGSHVSVMGVANVSSGQVSNVEVSWNTTPTAKIIESLIGLSSAYAATVNNSALQTLVNTVINNNTTGDTGDDIHPSLVDSASIAAYINNNSGNLPSVANSTEISNYRLTPQTISGNISGITYSIVGLNQAQVKHIPPTKVYCNDPASNIVTVTDVDGNYTITGVTPGGGYTVTAEPEFHTIAKSTNVSSGATGINFSVTKQHYIEHSIDPNYGITRFKTTRPINIQLITPSGSIGYTSSHRQAVIEALEMWERLASDKVSFNVLTDIADNDPNIITKKNESDIYIQWASQLNYGNAVGVAVSFPNTSNNSIPAQSSGGSIYFSQMPYNSSYRSAIGLGIKDPYGNILPYHSLRSIAAHEVGHSLGLAKVNPGTGNSHPQSDITNLMYPSVDSSAPKNLNVGPIDLNTLRFLYSLTPNVTRD